MRKAKQVTDTNSFRIPNSITEGLTTSTAADLNKLTAFQMVTLLGLLKLVDPNNPGRIVRTTPSKILEIIEVSRQVAHAVGRKWGVADGESREKQYASRRYSPWHMQQIHQALLALHQQTVVIRRSNKKEQTDRWVEDYIVHILDTFGYRYEQNGIPLDLDDLPPDAEKKNVGSDERPVWRVALRKSGGEPYDKPTGILFRLNMELADELRNNRKKGSIGFTHVAGMVFGLLREFMQQPWAIRLIILILRQVGESCTRKLGPLMDGLGMDPEHPQRAFELLADTLERLKTFGLVVDFAVDLQASRLRLTINRNWHREVRIEEKKEAA